MSLASASERGGRGREAEGGPKGASPRDRAAPDDATQHITSTAVEGTVRYLQEGNWEKAHANVQDDASALGCWAHGIVHMLEGDLENARYWYRKANRPVPEDVNAQTEISALALAVDEAPK